MIIRLGWKIFFKAFVYEMTYFPCKYILVPSLDIFIKIRNKSKIHNVNNLFSPKVTYFVIFVAFSSLKFKVSYLTVNNKQ